MQGFGSHHARRSGRLRRRSRREGWLPKRDGWKSRAAGTSGGEVTSGARVRRALIRRRYVKTQKHVSFENTLANEDRKRGQATSSSWRQTHKRSRPSFCQADAKKGTMLCLFSILQAREVFYSRGDAATRAGQNLDVGAGAFAPRRFEARCTAGVLYGILTRGRPRISQHGSPLTNEQIAHLMRIAGSFERTATLKLGPTRSIGAPGPRYTTAFRKAAIPPHLN